MAHVISQQLVGLLAQRMAVRMGVWGAAKVIALRAARPHPAWIAAGAIWAVYELATAEPEIDVSRMQGNMLNDLWEEEDMSVFRRIFLSSQAYFLGTANGQQAEESNQKYILIPSQIMPMVAQVDALGIGRFGNQLIYDRAGRHTRRRAATAGKGPAGLMTLRSGVVVPGSWEEYPFAVTYAQGQPGAQIGRVPLTENWSQGGLIAAAKYYQSITDGETVGAYVV